VTFEILHSVAVRRDELHVAVAFQTYEIADVHPVVNEFPGRVVRAVISVDHQ
jgi:hypothetical protein